MQEEHRGFLRVRLRRTRNSRDTFPAIAVISFQLDPILFSG